MTSPLTQPPARSRESGFSILEALIAVAILLLVFSTAIPSLRQTVQFGRVIGNRNEMHASVRGATELMQQEIGQAGRVALPAAVSLTSNVAKGQNMSVTMTSTAGLFVGAQIIVGTNDQLETVTVSAIPAAGSVTATFGLAHTSGESVRILGGFASGVVPPSMTNGSTGLVLKMYGDINDDGDMLYIEYTCDLVANSLYRNVMSWKAAAKPAKSDSMILLSNIIANPGNAPCFTYQTEVVNGVTFVTGVAVTLSVRSAQIDTFSKQNLSATKTLLNVSPRNIFLVWTMASIGVTNRLQPMPASILALLP